MAVAVTHAGATGKLRRPWATVLLSLIPLYWFVWYYRINRELRDFGRRRGDEDLATARPRLSLLAVSLGGLIVVPAYVSLWRTARRIQRAERVEGDVAGGLRMLAGLLTVDFVAAVATNLETGPAARLALVATVIARLTITALVQRRLNAVWRRSNHLEEG